MGDQKNLPKNEGGKMITVVVWQTSQVNNEFKRTSYTATKKSD